MKLLTVRHEAWPIAGTFTIARGSKTTADVIVVELEEQRFRGRGEAVPYKHYDETVAQCLNALEGARAQIEIGNIPAHLPKAACNAVDCALWDLAAKHTSIPAWQTAGLAALRPLVTAYTLSLDTPEAMAAKAAVNAHMPLLKLKLGQAGDEQRLVAVRAAAPHARLIVDANEGWSVDNLLAMLHACERVGVELVEQPLPASDDEYLRHVKRNLLICADESAHDAKGLVKLKGLYDAVNIKLDKTGGLTGALEMASAAKALDFRIMVGCMLATSLAMAPAFIVGQQADYVDLDGPLLLAKDREPGLVISNGVIQPPPTALWG